MEFEAPENIDNTGGNFLDTEGTFHTVVTEIKEGEGQNGNPMDGITVYMDVLAGTVEGCARQTTIQSLFAPNLTESPENQERSKKALAAFFIATGTLVPSQLGKPVKVPVQDAVGKQLVVKLVRKMNKNDQTGKYDVPSKFLKINFHDIYHVDDPDVASIPKNEDAMSMIPGTDRHTPDWFAFKAKKAAKPTPVEAASEQVDVAELFG